MRLVLFMTILFALSFLTACQPVGERAEFKSLNRAPTVTFTSQDRVDLSNQNTFTLNGTCSENGEEVVISGYLNLNTTCAFGLWSITTNLSGAPDGIIQLYADHKNAHGFPAYRAYETLYKDSVIAVSTIVPNAGPLSGGTLVTITGRNFQAGASVDLDGSACTSITVVNSTTITCLTPAHAPGIANLIITSLDTTTTTKLNAYTYQGAPTVTNVTPSAGAITGGTLVTITGTGFLSGATVFLGTSPCTGVAILNSTTLTCATTAHAPGTVDASVTNTDSQSGTGAGIYTYQPAPTITAVSPNTGSATGGTAIAITGSNFLAGATVDLGGVACTGITVVSPTTITCTTAARTEGIVSVKVTNTDNQEGMLASSFAYGYTTINVNLAGKLPESTGLTIRNNTTGETLALNNNGTFSFMNAWAGASSYSVSILTQPVNNICTVSSASGVIPSASPITATVNCIPTTYRLGGVITGLSAGETITIKGNNTLGTDTNQQTFTGIGADIYYELPEERYAGRYYSLSIISSSPTKYCTFTDSTKKEGVLSANLSDANITCNPRVVGNCEKGSGDLWEPNGQINAMICDGNDNLIIGGSFTQMAPNIGGGIIVDSSSGVISHFLSPKINGTVYASIPDGKGGWFVAGSFTKIGSITRNRIAHFYNDSNLDPNWNTDVNYNVSSLALSGSTLFIGGSFTSVNGISRNGMAALSTSDGSIISSFNANVSGSISAIAISGSIIYVGGSFTSIGGVARNNIAAINASNGSIISNFNPDANSSISSLLVSDSTLYLGGWFTTISGTPRNYIAAVNTSDGSLISNFNPSTNSQVSALAISGSTLYLGGVFTSVGGVFRSRLAAVNTFDGSLILSFDPNPNSLVFSLTLSGTTLFIGGAFTSVQGSTRSYVAAINTTTGILLPNFHPNTNYFVRSLQVSDSSLFIGGAFTTVGGVARYNIAALNSSTGSVTEFISTPNYSVYSLALSGTTLYLGGTFTTPRSYIAAVDVITGSLTAFNPSPNGAVFSIILNGPMLYMGGTFTMIGGTPRNRVAAINAGDGSLVSSFNPNSNGIIRTLFSTATTLYMGGDFTTIGGITRNYISEVDATTGSLTSFNPNANNIVRSLTLSNSELYFGGDFTIVNGLVRNHVAAVNVSDSSVVSTFNLNANDSVSSLAISGSTLYLGGLFTTINASFRPRVVAVNTLNGNLVSSFNLNIDSFGQVSSLTISGSSLYIGGLFTPSGGHNRNNFTIVNALDGTPP